MYFIFILYFYAVFPKLIKTEQTIQQLLNFQQILLDTRTSPSQKLNVVASFVLELLGFLLYIYIYTIFSATFRKLIKTEQTIEKSPYFREILLSTRSSFIQNFNVVASFALELLRFVFYISIYTAFLRQKNLCNSVRTFLKIEQTIEKPPNLAKIIVIICKSHRENFNATGCFLLELLGH